MARSDLQLRIAQSAVLRYGVAVVSVTVAAGLALLAQHDHSRNVEVPLFLFAVALSAWFAGSGPAVVALVLCVVFFCECRQGTGRFLGGD